MNKVSTRIKILAAIIITGIICISGTAFAANKIYQANEVEFIPSNTNRENGFTSTNVGDALNQLYEKSNNQFHVTTSTTNNVKTVNVSGLEVGKTYIVLISAYNSTSSGAKDEFLRPTSGIDSFTQIFYGQRPYNNSQVAMWVNSFVAKDKNVSFEVTLGQYFDTANNLYVGISE